ncbi:putative bifunctional diguanylate cyclase/phosphodiesterase [Nocardioides nitrophenolicus]|uniref:putative bifunctional diguanylate cyclase/phosphodiesterase n=1 Tax=Nocardioides nitrophenolicus TaxID=60489 RepID=UPI00195AD5E9|nr:bifunctional diguanylate cyclase/phosphodiesterase [Nocardioides nitrophenolicus]MBM7519935.1 diguanylate cyclase (GGDEF)-like protein [Nocardioides nitrophenolicus]
MAERVVAYASWAWLIVGLAANQVAQSAIHVNSQAVLLTTLTIFFPMLLLRLALAAWLYPERRRGLLLLLAAVLAWSLGSMSVNAESAVTRPHFPAPAEWLFLASYLGMAGYLMLDVDRRQQRQTRGWLDIAVICGATSCVASLLLVTPIQLASGQEGVPLLLALIYPLADMVLALAVFGQWLLQARSDRRKSVMLVIAFTLLACADSGFALQASARTYDFANASNALWGGAFALLVAAACRPPQSLIRKVPKAAGTAVLVSAGVVATAVLMIRPDESLAYYTLPPALLTMVTVAWRMGLALKDANRATEAFALSRTDDLTKLPNRRAVRVRLEDGLQDHKPLALMLLDLDGFKEINDGLGHHVGDTVLRLVAVRMREAVDPHHMVARLGGDEFAIILAADDEIELLEIAHQVLRDLAKPIAVEGIEISPSGSIGITVALADDPDSGEMLRRADVAMYQAKNAGMGAALYDAELDEFSRSRLQLAEELRKGIADGQIEVWYQPQLDVATMRISGVEALVRWRHPVQGVISPVSFLPAARRAGLMPTLSAVVARQAVRDHHRRLQAGLDLRVAVNCAPTELLSQAFLPQLYAAMDESGVPAEGVVLEVTEDSFLGDPQHTRDVLQDLRSHGVQVSIDDYGTGFSSLTYLRNLPVQELKIDRSLVRNVSADSRSRMIVASTIQLAHALDMRIVAEGVENAADLEVLIEMGIDTVQGYHLASPMPAVEMERWVRDWTPQALTRALHLSAAKMDP